MNGDIWQLETHKEWAESGWRIVESARRRTLDWFQLPYNDTTHDILLDYELGEKSLKETIRALKAERQRTENQGGESK